MTEAVTAESMERMREEMEENNRNNVEGYLPDEIPIPGAQNQNMNPYGAQEQNNNPYGAQNQSNSPYGAQNQNTNPYGMQSQNMNPYGQQNQSNSPYGAQNQNNDPYGQNQIINPYGAPNQNNDPYGQQVYPHNPTGKKKGSAAKIIIGVACAVVAVIVIGIGAMAYFRSTPKYKISKGFYNLGREISEVENPLLQKIGLGDLMTMMQEEGSHVESSLDFSTEFPFIGTATFGIDTDFYKDMQAKELNSDTSLSMMNYDFAHVNIYANEDVFCFSIPELFMEDMYIDNENVVSQFNNSILGESGYAEDVEDFSIDLFGDGEKKTALDVFRDISEVQEQFEEDLKACRDAMTIEKAGKGVYRVVFPAKETDRLIRNYVETYSSVYGMGEDLEIFTEYDKVILSDVSLLFEIDGNNRIESIVLEEPVKMLDGSASAEGELFFMGEERSIDLIQGKLSVDVEGRGTREAIGQMQLTPSKEDYQLNVDMKLVEGKETLDKIKFAVNCDAVKDRFDITYSQQNDDNDLEVVFEGSFDDIVQGESLELDLEKVEITVNGEESYRITGDITIEPLRDKVKATVKPKTAFFEMSWSDWEDIIDRIDDAYGSLLNSLW